MFDFRVEPLTFREFLGFKGKSSLTPSKVHRRELQKLLGQHLKTQGFPELVDVEDRDIIIKYVKESIEYVLTIPKPKKTEMI